MIYFLELIFSCRRSVYSIPVPTNGSIQNARFNRKGTHLLCSESGSSPAIDDVQQLSEQSQEPMRLTAFGYRSEEGTEGVCFAGKDDELAVVSSLDKGVYIWSLPVDGTRSKVDQPLIVLRGHKGYISEARFSAKYGVLATAGSGEVKLWSSNKF